jgi:DNA mismatch endonuclease (patch repair protein)
MDHITKEKRSKLMASIRSKNTAPEIAVRRLLHKMGYRFRLHQKLPGSPDICLPKYKTVIFVHGCYWHRHKGCARGRSSPSSNKNFWIKKFKDNVARDKQNRKSLKALGWNIILVWQCELKDEDSLTKRLNAVLLSTTELEV